MGKSNPKQTTTTTLDPATQAYQNQVHAASAAAGQAGPGASLLGAMSFGMGAAQGAGQQGLNALSGDPAAVQKLMNPYTQQVIDANNANLAHTDAVGMNAVNSNATQAGAFGGSRAAVAQGSMLAQNALANNQLNAGLLSQGYDTAMNQANQLAGYGFQGAQLGANLGLQGVGNDALWNARMLQQGQGGPYGQTSTTTQSGGSNPINGMLGGAEAGSVFGAPGAIIGGGIGLLGSLF